MKYSILIGLLLFFSCKTNRDLSNIQAPSSEKDQVILDLDYEGEMIPAMQLDKLAETQFKTVDPSLIFVIEPPLLNLDYKGEEIPAIHLEKLPIKGLELLYIPKPGEPASLNKNMPYEGEEIPAMLLDNSTLKTIKGMEGILVLPKMKEDN